MEESPYRWLHQLGSGSSGIVWAAERDGEQIAVKVLRARPGSAHAEAIRRELKLGPLLAGHPGIVPVRRIEAFGNALCLEMAMVRGPSLAQVLDGLAASGKAHLPATVVVRWGIEVLQTLDWASHRVAPGHPRSFVHRDIKPANLLLDPSGRIRITDFGLARAEAALGFQTTQSGVLKGSPRFMAPELLQTGQVDSRADQFSVAVVLYELLGGEPLYVGHTLDEILALASVADVRSALTTLDAPRELVAVLRRMLGRQASDRFPASRQAAAALEALDLSGPAVADVLPSLLAAGGRRSAFPDDQPPGSSTLPIFEEADDIATTVEDDEVVVRLPRDHHSPRQHADTDEITRTDHRFPVPEASDPATVISETQARTPVAAPPREHRPEPPEVEGPDLGEYLDTWPGSRPARPVDEDTEKPVHTVGRVVASRTGDEVSTEYTVGKYMQAEDDGEHTVGHYLQPTPWGLDEDSAEYTVGQFLEREQRGPTPALAVDEDDQEATVGSWLQPMPAPPRPPGDDLHSRSTVESRPPLDAFLDEEETRVEPALAYSDVLPPSLELDPASREATTEVRGVRRKLLLGLGGVLLVAAAVVFVAGLAAMVAAAVVLFAL